MGVQDTYYACPTHTLPLFLSYIAKTVGQNRKDYVVSKMMWNFNIQNVVKCGVKLVTYLNEIINVSRFDRRHLRYYGVCQQVTEPEPAGIEFSFDYETISFTYLQGTRIRLRQQPPLLDNFYIDFPDEEF